MRPWQDEILALLQLKRSADDLFEGLRREAAKVGFEFSAYGMRIPRPIANPQTIWFNNYPSQWQARYVEQYLQIDPTVKHGSASQLPLVWSDDVFHGAQDFWDDARSCGIRHGWAQSSIDPCGIKGMLTLARSNEPLADKELAANGYKMSWLAQIAHLCMTRLVAAQLLPEKDVRLTERELAVLRWTAEGKTSADISEILKIATRTVNFHITNAMQKLNCSNKTAAVVRAATLGFLY